MFNSYFPHNWLDLKGLRVIWLVFFYATLAFGLYAVYNWMLVLQIPDELWASGSAPLKQIYGYAAGASVLAGTAELCIWRILGTLHKLQQKTPAK